MAKITSHLWYEKDAEEAIRFYVSVVPGASLGDITTMPSDSPAGPAGSVKVIEFSLGDQAFMAIEAGPLDPFNHSFSVMVECDTQDEIDRLWDALGRGGSYEPCGWLRDRWGLAWQIVPGALGEMMKHPDRERARRATDAMLTMGKLDLSRLQAAFDAER